ncbi:hypothetical protein ABW19_dt0200684 [Dactylella cylindrospora]|nr:hypothetical protein ABW19_dt0200684 [Dactylella cylindrospora]
MLNRVSQIVSETDKILALATNGIDLNFTPRSETGCEELVVEDPLELELPTPLDIGYHPLTPKDMVTLVHEQLENRVKGVESYDIDAKRSVALATCSKFWLEKNSEFPILAISPDPKITKHASHGILLGEIQFDPKSRKCVPNPAYEHAPNLLFSNDPPKLGKLKPVPQLENTHCGVKGLIHSIPRRAGLTVDPLRFYCLEGDCVHNLHPVAKDRRGFDVHISRTHEIKQYICKHCKNQFGRSDNLGQHEEDYCHILPKVEKDERKAEKDRHKRKTGSGDSSSKVTKRVGRRGRRSRSPRKMPRLEGTA